MIEVAYAINAELHAWLKGKIICKLPYIAHMTKLRLKYQVMELKYSFLSFSRVFPSMYVVIIQKRQVPIRQDIPEQGSMLVHVPTSNNIHVVALMFAQDTLYQRRREVLQYPSTDNLILSLII